MPTILLKGQIPTCNKIHVQLCNTVNKYMNMQMIVKCIYPQKDARSLALSCG